MDTKEAIEYLKSLKYNPYPEDIFSNIPKEDYIKVNKLLKNEMGYPLDRLMGNIGRSLYKSIIGIIDINDIIKLLQEGEKYRQMWEKLKAKWDKESIRREK